MTWAYGLSPVISTEALLIFIIILLPISTL